jgi:serine/threonine protein kinase
MDLKPDNILLDDHMMAKITDFGLSRLDENSQTMDSTRYVTFGYCAPEYIHGGKRTFKLDMYSLGVIIIELVTGYKGTPDISNVLRRWRHRWRKSRKETPWAYQELQITKCIGIGLRCQEDDPFKLIWPGMHTQSVSFPAMVRHPRVFRTRHRFGAAETSQQNPGHPRSS